MTRLTLRSLAARRLRTALTALAVVLGVAMIAGTYVLTDTIDRAFGQLFAQANAGVDVVVVPDTPDVGGGARVGVDEALLERVRAVPGVATARGEVLDVGISLLGRDGEPVRNAGPPTLGVSATGEGSGAFTATAGRLPRTAGEVALDTEVAAEEGFAVGDTVTVVGDDGARRYRLVGLARFGTSGSLAGASAVIFTLPEAQRVLGKEGRLDAIDARAAPGVAPATAARAVRAALRGTRVQVRTGEENAAREAAELQEDFGFLRTALLVFAGVALFVGAFVIYNTFSITVAQRARELALLRTLGASRRQVLRSVVLEAALVGLVAALLGLAGGLLVAPAIIALFDRAGIELPTAGTVVRPRTVVVALVVGVGVTVAASLAPALRATRVAPMAAMREGLVAPARSGRRRTAAAAALGAAGVAALVAGLAGAAAAGTAAALLGAGAVAIFLAVALLSPHLVRPLARAVGAPIERIGGVTGRLARENATRNPTRTAVTAAALMVGLALVTFVAIFAAGLRGSVDRIVDRSFAGDLTVRSDDGFSPVPAAVAGAVADVPGVATVSGVRFAASAVVGGEGDLDTVGVDPATIASVYRADVTSGSFAALGPGRVLADAAWARGRGVALGDRLRLVTPTGERPVVEVAGLLEEGDLGLLGGGIVVANDVLRRRWGERRDALVLVDLAPGADPAPTRRRIDALLAARFPGTRSQDREEVKEQQAGQIDQILGLFYALLALSVLVSLFGIVNTLALSIFERTRELGLLRAIGTTRRQVRRTVRYEATITALIGAVLGIVLGTLFALAISRPLAVQGFSFVLPVGTLVVLLLAAAALGVVAAIGPGRRAARVDVLRALAYE